MIRLACRRICLLFVLLPIGAGCALTATAERGIAIQPSEPPSGRTADDFAHAWEGVYSGTADVYLAEHTSWFRGRPFTLTVRRVEWSSVSVLGIATTPDGNEVFELRLNLDGSTSFRGSQGQGMRRLEYTIHKEDARLRGTVEALIQDAPDTPPHSSSKWEFDAQITGRTRRSG